MLCRDAVEEQHSQQGAGLPCIYENANEEEVCHAGWNIRNIELEETNGGHIILKVADIAKV